MTSASYMNVEVVVVDDFDGDGDVNVVATVDDRASRFTLPFTSRSTTKTTSRSTWTMCNQGEAA